MSETKSPEMIFANALNVDINVIRQILDDNGLELDFTCVRASGYEGSTENIHLSDVKHSCCCGEYLAPYGEYEGNPCGRCGQSTRCYKCALSGDGYCLAESEVSEECEECEECEDGAD